MTTPTPIAVQGITGRMGHAVLRALMARDDVELVAALVRPGSNVEGKRLSEILGERAPAMVCTAALAVDCEPAVLIEFSSPGAFDAALASALDRRIAFVSGTTGLSTEQQAALDRAAASIPVLWSANFSLGVAMLARLVAQAARELPDWDCEITEAHHALKQDAPSGTALALGREVASARDQDFDAVAALSRVGASSLRKHDSIGFSAIRAGDIVGEHTEMFAAAGERIELVHRATDRDIFARGAVAAAHWIAGKSPGRFSLADVLVDAPEARARIRD